jgi:hypothetical protein
MQPLANNTETTHRSAAAERGALALGTPDPEPQGGYADENKTMMEAVAKKIADLAEGRESVKQRGSDEGVAPLVHLLPGYAAVSGPLALNYAPELQLRHGARHADVFRLQYHLPAEGQQVIQDFSHSGSGSCGKSVLRDLTAGGRRPKPR